MKSTILHIGFPKTANKWFQKFFYPLVEDLYMAEREDLSRFLLFNDIFEFDPHKLQNELLNKAKNKRVILCEDLILGGLDVHYGSGEYLYLNAQKLKKTFKNVDVVILVRNQHCALESAYSHYIKMGGTYSINKYLGLGQRFRNKYQNYHFFNPAIFRYYSVIKLYVELFGRENVHVFLYEDLLNDPDSFMDRFCNEIKVKKANEIKFHIKENSRLSSIALLVARFLNRFTHRNTLFKNYLLRWNFLYPYIISICKHIDSFEFIRRRRFGFDREMHEWIADYYKDSNRQLVEFVDPQKLKDYGYPL